MLSTVSFPIVTLSKTKPYINLSGPPHNISGSPQTLFAAMDIFWNTIPYKLPAGSLCFSGSAQGLAPIDFISSVCSLW